MSYGKLNKDIYENRRRLGYVTEMFEFMINFLIRMAVGVMLILVINGFFVSKEIPVRVGLNPITMAASGTLGVPGVALLYGVAFYESR